MKSMQVRSWLPALCLAACALLAPTDASAQKRIAMVIGNNTYAGPLALNNPVNDAELIARMLKEDLGFEVLSHRNLGRAEMHDAARELQEKATGADVVVVYYSGHGVQGDVGTNYLIPVDARIRTPEHIQRDAVPITVLLQAIEHAGARVALLVLDSCRDYPFGKGGAKGLAPVTSENVLVAYATEPGRTADEGDGRYSPYARALVQNLKRTDITILHALDDVKKSVSEETGRKQQPTRSGNLRHDACLLPGRCMVYAPTPAQRATAARSAEEEAEHWKRLGDSREAWRFLDHQLKFPNGMNGEAARQRAGFATRTRSGCALRETVPLPQDTEVDWSGGCVDGLADGTGVKSYWRGGVKSTEWQATHARGIPVGSWVGTFPLAPPTAPKEVTINYDRNGELLKMQKVITGAGSVYVGATAATTQSPLSNRPHGRGHMKFADGGEYEGDYIDGAYEGRGTLTLSPSAAATSFLKYTGEFSKGRPAGKGTMWYVDGSQYEGQFQNGMREGSGRHTGSRGQYTEGEWSANRPVRATVVHVPSDNPDAPRRYAGTFKDGLYSGEGLMTYVSGAVYRGEFQRGMRHGRGELIIPPREAGSLVKYTGDFRDNIASGQGVLEWNNGARYVGGVAEQRPHGSGEMRRPDGTIRRGTFDKSRPVGEDPR
jgi:hypothetical protein